MSFDPATALLEIGKGAIDKIWPDPIRRAEELRKLEAMRQKGQLAELTAEVQLLTRQMDINKEEAKSSRFFVAGWRPFVGWVCGLGLAYVSIVEPVMRFIANMSGYTGSFPLIDTTLTMQVLLGMLGLGVMRTKEKIKKVNS